MKKEEIRRYIYNQVMNGNFSFLPGSIARGIVYKIPTPYNLLEHDFEIAYLYLREGAFVLSHEHTKDIERYKCIDGILRINGDRVEENICEIHKSHCIDKVEIDTIIETCKLKQEYLINNKIKTIDSKTFDKVLKKSLLTK